LTQKARTRYKSSSSSQSSSSSSSSSASSKEFEEYASLRFTSILYSIISLKLFKLLHLHHLL
ncbi:hypothetical protein WUBG_03600, partial [Wuchereria bancrofti]